MITHINCMKQIRLLKKQLKVASLGICMSKETMEKLVTYGIPRNQLCYVNPAHDGNVKPRQYVIGIMHRCYDQSDVRKRASAILEVLEAIEPSFFKFIIMGAGWDNIVDRMRNWGFAVTYYNDFDYDTYNNIIAQLDYLLYMGTDEGSMGYLDAIASGVGTIVTPQGFHLDNGYPIDYPCKTIKQFRDAFLDLQNKRKAKIESVKDWTWQNYAKKHVEIWYYLKNIKTLEELYCNQSVYEDGIFSMLIEDCRL